MSEHAYIGIKKCGCVVAATMDMPEHAKQVGKDVAGFISEGLTVERISTEEVRVRLGGCKCECDEKPATETVKSDQMELGEEPQAS
jgi:hypothetical protein